jgi:methanogenic corrinoid protein MtbC1
MRLNPVGVEASNVLKTRRELIAVRVTDLYFEAHPGLEAKWKDARKKCTEDTLHHVDHLSEALHLGQPALFTEYAAWIAKLLAHLRIPGEALSSNLAILGSVVASEMEAAGGALASQYLDAAIARIAAAASELPCYMDGSGYLDVVGRDYLAALLRGDRRLATELIREAVERGAPVKEIYLEVFQRSQYEIGRLWQINEISVAKEHYCTAATQLIMSQLYPHIFAGDKNGGTYVGMCVSGNLHEIGGRMIADFFEMAGWNSYYLGANTPSEGVVETLVERGADVLGISATMTAQLGAVEELVEIVRAKSACAGVKILVGGYSFNIAPELWRAVDADGTARDAEGAIQLAGRLIERDAVNGRPS